MDWLPEPFAWFRALAADRRVTDLGVRPLTEAESRRCHDLMTGDHATEGGPSQPRHTSQTLNASREILAESIPVAEGPLLAGSLWFVRRNEPAGLWFSPNPALPPFLWIPAGGSVSGVRGVLADYLVETPRRAGLPSIRGVIGGGGWDPDDLRRFMTLSRFLESTDGSPWGSAFDERPVRRPPDNPAAAFLAAQESRAQIRGSVWSLTAGMKVAPGYFTIEHHQQTLFVASARHRPAEWPGHHATVAAYNRTFGRRFPVDAPLELIAQCLGFEYVTAAEIEAALESDESTGDVEEHLEMLAAVRHNDRAEPHDHTALAVYGRYVGHPDEGVRRTLASIAFAYKLTDLLGAVARHEPDPDLRAVFERALATPDWDVCPHPPEARDEGAAG